MNARALSPDTKTKVSRPFAYRRRRWSDAGIGVAVDCYNTQGHYIPATWYPTVGEALALSIKLAWCAVRCWVYARLPRQ